MRAVLDRHIVLAWEKDPILLAAAVCFHTLADCQTVSITMLFVNLL